MTLGQARAKQSVYIVGVAGGSGSGKTTFAKALLERLPKGRCSLIYQDNYYIDQSSRFDHDGGSVNFDHPAAIDFELIAQHLSELKKGQAVAVPTYDFATHRRTGATLEQRPCPILLVDGILIFHPEKVRNLFDEMIFFDTPEALRFQRRLDRDVHERGRTPEGVRAQFLHHVKPMHDQFVEPTKDFAHTIVRDLGEYARVLEHFTEKYHQLCSDR